MTAIFRKEFESFFNNITGYIIVILFVLTNSLFLWFFKGYSNIIQAGFADLNPFFHNCSWIFAFLIPAITMKSYTDEYKNGTIEILKTLPITHQQINYGKFLANLSIAFICLIPTFIFVISVYLLGNPVGNIDLGSTFISYTGLLLVCAAYTAIGMYSSMITKNNISAFILAVSINCFLFFGLDAFANITNGEFYFLSTWGIQHHFNSILRGVIDTSDIVYFTSVTVLFLYLTTKLLKK